MVQSVYPTVFHVSNGLLFTTQQPHNTKTIDNVTKIVKTFDEERKDLNDGIKNELEKKIVTRGKKNTTNTMGVKKRKI